MDRGAWRVAAHGIAQSRTRLKQLSRPHAGGTRDPCDWNVALFWLPNTSSEGATARHRSASSGLCGKNPGPAGRREARSVRGPLRTEAPSRWAQASLRPLTATTTGRPRAASPATRGPDAASRRVGLTVFPGRAGLRGLVGHRGTPPETTSAKVWAALLRGCLRLSPRVSLLLLVLGFSLLGGGGAALGARGRRRPEGPRPVCSCVWLKPQTPVPHLVSGRIYLWSPVLSALVCLKSKATS